MKDNSICGGKVLLLRQHLKSRDVQAIDYENIPMNVA